MRLRSSLRWGLAGIALVLLPGLAPAGDSDDARVWLERMSRAAHTLNYDGTFIYEHNNHMQTMRIIHASEDGAERERLVTLSGPSREVVRNEDTVTCILPDNNSVVVEKSGPTRPFLISVPEQLDQLQAYYRFELGGKERIAGRTAQKIKVKPRDIYRYGHRLWVDEQVGLLLKSELLNEDGLIVEQVLFTSLDLLDSVPAALLQPQTEGKDLVWHRRKRGHRGDQPVPQGSGWRVAKLPPAFDKDIHRKHFMSARNAEVEHMVFSDGLASVSVFIEAHDPDDDTLLGHMRMGAINTFARTIGGHRVTVVGEVPAATVRLIGESIERIEAGDGS